MLEYLFADLSVKNKLCVRTRKKSLENEKVQVESCSFGLFFFPLNYILEICMCSGLGRGDLETSSIF